MKSPKIPQILLGVRRSEPKKKTRSEGSAFDIRHPTLYGACKVCWLYDVT